MAEEIESEEIELGIDQEGPIQIFSRKKWKPKWGILSGGGIYYKNKKKDVEIRGPIVFKGGSFTKTEIDPKRKYGIKIVVEGNEHVISFEDENSRKDWLEALEANKDKEVGAGKGAKGKVKQSRSMRIKKNISGSVATSSAGKGLIKEFMGKDGVKLLDLVKNIIIAHQDKKKATEVENNIIKIAVKVILLWKNKDITTNDIASTVPKVKAIWSDIIDFCEMSFSYDPAKIKKHGEELQIAFANLLANRITDKNIEKMKSTMSYLTTEDLLNVLFQDEKNEDLKKELCEILRGSWINVFKNDKK